MSPNRTQAGRAPAVNAAGEARRAPRVIAATAEAELQLLHLAGGGGNSSGVRKTVAELAHAQAALGHGVQVHIAGPDTFDDEPPGAVKRPVRVTRSGIAGPSVVGFAPAGERWIRSPEASGFGVVHQHGIWPAHSRLTMLWRARYGRPTVIAPHGSLQHAALADSRWKKALALMAYERRNLEDATCLHATAEQEIVAFRDFGLRNPVAVIPNAVSDHWIDMAGNGARFRVMHGIPAGVPLMLFLSLIHPGKGLHILVDAMARMATSSRDWHLVIAGPVSKPAYEAQVRQAIAAHGLGSRVHWVGELHRQEKRDAFTAASVFVLPSVSDNFGIVVVEALGAAVPVITTHGALPWSLLETHGCGWWVPHTASHLLRALNTAVSMDPEHLSAMGRRGRTLVEQQFRWVDSARQSTQLYRWLLGQAEQPDFVVLD